MSFRLPGLLALLFCTTMLAAPAAADLTLTPLETPGPLTYVWGLSGDGKTVIGIVQTAGGELHPVFWKDGHATDLGLPGEVAYPSAVSANGSTIVGVVQTGGYAQPVMWVNGIRSSMALLPGYIVGVPTNISDDGTIVTGVMYDMATQEIVRWVNGVPAGTGITATTYQSFVPTVMSRDGSAFTVLRADNVAAETLYWKNGVTSSLDIPSYAVIPTDMTSNGDKVVVTGYHLAASDSVAYLWDNGSYNALPTLGGDRTDAKSISRDGSIIAGIGNDASGTSHLLKWENTALQDLGVVAGFADSTVGFPAVRMSDDGNVIVYGSKGYEPYKWTSSGGLKTFSQALTDAGVNITGWDFTDNLFLFGPSGLLFGSSPLNVSRDGQYIMGNGTQNGVLTPYMISSGGVISVPEVVESVQPVTKGAAQSQSAMSVGFSQSILAARQAFSAMSLSPAVTSSTVMSSASQPSDFSAIMPAAGGADPWRSRYKWSSYMIGDLGIGQSNNFSSNALSGAAGIIHRANDEVAIGAGIIGSRSDTDLRLDGRSKLASSGMSVLAAYEPLDHPLRLYGSAMAAYLDMSMDRHYMNGATVDGSASETHGFGYGGAIQAGWKISRDENTSIMPYAGIDASHTRLDGYQETGGGFPATVADQTGYLVTTSLGAELSRQVTAPLELRARAAWGHRVSCSGGAVTATVGAITQAVPYQQGDRDWAEFGGTAVYKLTDTATVMGDLSVRAGETSLPAVNATIGLNIGF